MSLVQRFGILGYFCTSFHNKLQILMNFIHKRGIFFLFLCCVCFKTQAQLNIKIGYTGAYTKVPSINKIVNDFNVAHPELDDVLDEFKFLNGIEIGLRYRMRSAGFELSWANMSKKSDAFAVGISEKWYLSLTDYSLSAESYFGNFGIGAGLGHRSAFMKTTVPGAPRKKKTVVDDGGFFTKLYLLAQIPGDKVGLAIKPYVQIPLRNLDFTNFSTELNRKFEPNFITPVVDPEKFLVFGISLVLYNGKQ